MTMRMIALMLVAGIGGCSGPKEQPAPGDAPRSKQSVAKEVRGACGSRLTYEGLKALAFRQAVKIRGGKSPLLERLYAQSVVRMEQPLVKSRDETLGVTVCSGRFVLELPPGFTDAFDGDRRLVGEIEYAAQPAADGSGLVYQMRGAEPIVYRLAAVALHEPPPPAAVPAPPVRTAQAPPPPAPPAQAEPATSGCAALRSRDERMICADRGLAKRARRVNEAYARAMSGADARTRRALEASSRRFLAYRRACPSEACLEEALEDRVEEIRDIARGRW